MAIVVLVTIPQDKAEKLAKVILKARACACVNILPAVKSLFWWEGKIDTEEESLMVIKTRPEVFSRLEELIKDNHPYAVPEIIALEIGKISKEYLQWLKSEVDV